MGVHVIITLGVPHDHRDRIRLDDQVLRQLPGLIRSSLSRRLVRIPNAIR